MCVRFCVRVRSCVRLGALLRALGCVGAWVRARVRACQIQINYFACVRACVRARACECVRACVRVCVRACVRAKFRSIFTIRHQNNRWAP